MNLNYSPKAFSQLTHNEHSKKSAIHEAGHAVAIYLGNRQKQLPPFCFQIYIKEQSNHFQLSRALSLLNDKDIGKLADDLLIQPLPFSTEKAAKAIYSEQMQSYENAFETDVISLLVGPLAEAKYVAMRDGELISPRLVNLNALHNYGGSSDLEILNKYLEYFIVEKAEREKKISELFLQAFSFINDRSNWHAISVLATYILAGRMNIIEGGTHIANGIPEGTIGNVRPDLHRNFNPWDRISEPSGLRAMLAEAGVHTDNIVAETGTHPLNSPEDWWSIAKGCGYRDTLAQLDAETLVHVREKNLSHFDENQVVAITTNVGH